MWPHRTTLRAALITAAVVGTVQLAAVLAAAFLDDTLWLPGPSVGLFEHPGMFAIVAGDAVLIVICTVASRMTLKMGRKLPSERPDLIRRYFRRYVLGRIFGPRGLFLRVLFLLVVVGALAVANQTVQMFDSVRYYGHTTFGDWGHDYSFVAVRLNLIVSWGIIIPLFFSYLICHAVAIRLLLRAVMRRNLCHYDEKHPDRCGGYSFFGWIDTLYVLGILTVLIEIVLVIISHDRITLGNLLAICALAGGALLVSIFSIGGMLRLLRRQKRALKLRSYFRSRHRSTPTTLDFAILNFGLNFSPYTTTAFRLAIGLRALIAAPAILRAVQYINAAT